MQAAKKIPWQKIIIFSVALIFVLFTAWLGLEVAYAADFDSTRRAAYLHVAGQLKSLFFGLYDFVKPIAQVGLSLLVLHWLVRRFYPSFDLGSIDWKGISLEKALLAVVALGFVSLSLNGGMDALVDLKEIMLVTLGLYFGMGSRKG